MVGPPCPLTNTFFSLASLARRYSFKAADVENLSAFVSCNYDNVVGCCLTAQKALEAMEMPSLLAPQMDPDSAERCVFVCVEGGVAEAKGGTLVKGVTGVGRGADTSDR